MARTKKAAQSAGQETEARAGELAQERDNHDSPDAGAAAEFDLEQFGTGASLEEQLATAAQEAEMYKDRFLRARADFENYRRRSVQFAAEGIREAQKQTFEAFLPVVDNLERAVAYQEQHQTDSVEDLLTGIRMTLLQVREVLERQEVKRIEALGEPFDPRYHEAVEVQTTECDVDTDTVVGEIQTGYLFGDTVLRPARVRVAQQRLSVEEPSDTP